MLCKEYEVNNKHRDLHGALLDSELLAEVYLRMTGGQSALSLESDESSATGSAGRVVKKLSANRKPIKIIQASDDELKAHQVIVEKMKAELW